MTITYLSVSPLVISDYHLPVSALVIRDYYLPTCLISSD